ncbi:MAG TPA: organic solvent resistance ABC transporter ATP-binding protein, partial [Acidobacteriaceae bacterium]
MNDDEAKGDADSECEQNSPGEQNSTGKLDSSGESVAEERLLRNAEPQGGTDVPLPAEDETPLEIPPELIREEVREAQENGSGPQTPAKPPEPYIVFDHVSKSFGDLHVLDDVNFEVMSGETLCILGRSGVGKSVSLQ